MLSVQPDMNIARQRRKLTVRRDDALDAGHLDQAVFLSHLVGRFDAAIAMGTPRPASEFLPMFDEEFDLS